MYFYHIYFQFNFRFTIFCISKNKKEMSPVETPKWTIINFICGMKIKQKKKRHFFKISLCSWNRICYILESRSHIFHAPILEMTWSKCRFEKTCFFFFYGFVVDKVKKLKFGTFLNLSSWRCHFTSQIKMFIQGLS